VGHSCPAPHLVFEALRKTYCAEGMEETRAGILSSWKGEGDRVDKVLGLL
jgi:hypothetical protein